MEQPALWAFLFLPGNPRTGKYPLQLRVSQCEHTLNVQPCRKGMGITAARSLLQTIHGGEVEGVTEPGTQGKTDHQAVNLHCFVNEGWPRCTAPVLLSDQSSSWDEPGRTAAFWGQWEVLGRAGHPDCYFSLLHQTSFPSLCVAVYKAVLKLVLVVKN